MAAHPSIFAASRSPLDDDTVPRVLNELYALDIKPDWWKLEPQASPEAWQAIDGAVDEGDPYCRGVVMLGLEASEKELEAAFAATVGSSVVKGFAVGRIWCRQPLTPSARGR